MLQNLQLLESLTRLHSKDAYDGAGLGLSICKKIVERHGGSISAASTEGKGIVFEIVLPVKRALTPHQSPSGSIIALLT